VCATERVGVGVAEGVRNVVDPLVFEPGDGSVVQREV
jgi:hypothetical protein